jgi:hypothetical protein
MEWPMVALSLRERICISRSEMSTIRMIDGLPQSGQPILHVDGSGAIRNGGILFMRVLIVLLLSLTLSLCASGIGYAQSAGARVAVLQNANSTNIDAAKATAPFTYILFWKQNDANTQQFAETIRKGTVRRPKETTWTSVDIRDAANQTLVAKYGVSRAPMPLALCVAENGAITAVFTRRPNDEALDRAIVTPAMVIVTKALQDKKIVVVHVKPAADSPLPYGALEFTKDATFEGRTAVVDVLASDATESRFLKDMEYNAASVTDSSVVVMAPPGVLVGKFASNVTMSDIATKLHAAGKCCNDPNCKHNKKANGQ